MWWGWAKARQNCFLNDRSQQNTTFYSLLNTKQISGAKELNKVKNKTFGTMKVLYGKSIAILIYSVVQSFSQQGQDLML